MCNWLTYKMTAYVQHNDNGSTTCNENVKMIGNSADDQGSTFDINDQDEITNSETATYSDENKCVPKDRGWAWLVLLALFVMTCGVRFTTCRNLLFVGSIITGVAYIITSQAEDIRLLLFSHGVLQGIGAGFMQPTALNMVGLYFEKRRGLANSIAVSGGSVGGLIFAPMITTLLSTYGYQGCVLILAGVLLNGCVSGALFRPASFYISKVRRKNEQLLKEERESKIHNRSLTHDTGKLFKMLSDEKLTTEANESMSPAENGSLILNSDFCPDGVIEGFCKTTAHRSMCDQEKNQNHRTYSADDIWQKRKGKRALYKDMQDDSTQSSNRTCTSTPILYCSDKKSGKFYTKRFAEAQCPIIDGDISSENFNKHLDIKRNRKKSEIEQVMKLKRFARIVAETFNFKLLKNPVFLAFLLQGSLICSGTVLAPIFIAPYARDIGVSTEDVATLVTVLSFIDLFSRIFIGYISDKGLLRRSSIVAIASVVVSISASLLRFCTNFTTLLGYSITLGLVSGVYFALWPVVIIDYLTLANFQTCLGFMALVHGFSVAGAFYLVGFLRDISGSYVLPHHVIGGATGLGAIILFLLPVIERL